MPAETAVSFHPRGGVSTASLSLPRQRARGAQVRSRARAAYTRPRAEALGKQTPLPRGGDQTLELLSSVRHVQRNLPELGGDSRETLRELRPVDRTRVPEVPEQLHDPFGHLRVDVAAIHGHRERASHELVVIERHRQILQPPTRLPRVPAVNVLLEQVAHLPPRGVRGGPLGPAPVPRHVCRPTRAAKRAPRLHRASPRDLVQPCGFGALVEKLRGYHPVDDRAREEDPDLVRGVRHVDGERLRILKDQIEPLLALVPGQDLLGRERTNELRDHLAFPRPSVERCGDRAFDHGGFERVAADEVHGGGGPLGRGLRGRRGGERRPARGLHRGGLVDGAQPSRSRTVGAGQELA